MCDVDWNGGGDGRFVDIHAISVDITDEDRGTGDPIL
jgi:hypothetical protein